jgi:hypothetical protein
MIASGPARATKEFFAPVTAGLNVLKNWASYAGCELAEGEDWAAVTFSVPHDFSAIITAQLILVSYSIQDPTVLSFYSTYGSLGEDAEAHEEDDIGGEYVFGEHTLEAIDLSGILAELVAGDFVGILILNAGQDWEGFILGVRFRYQ